MKDSRLRKLSRFYFIASFLFVLSGLFNLPISLGAPITAQAETVAVETNLHWNHDLMNIQQAWDDGYTGEGITIAILDTGFYHRHPDIDMVGGYSVFPDDAWSNDHSGHGTHIAGIIGANPDSSYPGIAPGADIYGIKIYHAADMDDRGYVSTDVASVIKGIRHAITIEADILVISSGLTFHDPNLYEIILEAHNQGMLIIAASGNGNTSVNYPASYDEVVAVTAIDEEMQPALDIIFGKENDFAAPGVNIGGLSIPESAYSFPYIFMSGSSQATPHVAGLAAIIMQKHNVRGQEAVEWMRRYTLDIGDANLYGHGLLHYVSDVDETEIVEDEPPVEEDVQPATGSDQTDDETSDSENESGEVRKPDSSRVADPENPGNADSAEYYQTDPIEQDDRQVLGYDVLPIVESGATLEIILNDYNSLYLTADQIREVRDRNIRLALTKDNVSWYILPGNFLSGEAYLRFYEGTPVGTQKLTGALSPIYTISIYQRGVRQNSHPTWMELKFNITDLPDTDLSQYDGYRYDKSSREWAETVTEISEDYIILRTRHTAPIGIFNAETVQEAEADAANDEIVDADEVSEDTDETYKLFQNPLFISTIILIVIIIGGLYVNSKRSK